jgi:SpoIID/LytB domain protein
MNLWRTKPFIAMCSAIAITFSFIATPARAADAPNPVPASFTLSGSGWGHGLGMSQYGAYGMALDDKNASEIIEHYYMGAKVAFEDTPTKLRVGLLQDKEFVALRGEKHPDKDSGGALTLWVDGVKQESTVAANKTIIFETVNDSGSPETKVTSSDQVLAQGSKILIKWSNSSSILNLSFGSSKQMAVNGLGTNLCVMNNCPHRYRYGYLEIISGSIGPKDKNIDLNVVNVLRLSDQYLYGLGEMPSSWHTEALKSQVIAARSFALIKSRTTQSYCDCSLDTTDGSQVFSGFSKEFASYGEKWKQAVNETLGTAGSTQAQKAKQGLVIKFGTETIPGYYSSSTGGKTQPRSEVWGTGSIPWLASVDDKWSQDPRVKNPNANWVDSISQAKLIESLASIKIEIPDVAALDVSKRFRSGGVSELRLRDSAGNIYLVEVGPGKDVSPDVLRRILDVKSTYISNIAPVSATTPPSSQAEVRSLESVARVNWPKTSIKPANYNFTGKVSPAQFGESGRPFQLL